MQRQRKMPSRDVLRGVVCLHWARAADAPWWVLLVAHAAAASLCLAVSYGGAAVRKSPACHPSTTRIRSTATQALHAYVRPNRGDIHIARPLGTRQQAHEAYAIKGRSVRA